MRAPKQSEPRARCLNPKCRKIVVRGTHYCANGCEPSGHGRLTLGDLLARASEPNARGCRIWAGSILKSTGYGRLKFDSRSYRAHRLSWELANERQVPDGMVVMHACDTPACIEPSHLTIGTVADNNRDMFEKRRHARGEQHGVAKLTQADVAKLRAIYRRGITRQVDLAAQFGISQTHVSRLIRGEYWKEAA